MSLKNSIFFLFTGILLFGGCKKKDNCPAELRTSSTILILPFGDSRVEGANSDFESYRYELWLNLIQNNWDFDFVGERLDRRDYPQWEGRCFDNEHQGTGGAVTSDLLEFLVSEPMEVSPDVVLLGIGGNDLLGEQLTIVEIVANIEAIINELQAGNPNIIIFLEQIAPGKSDFMTPEMTASFERFNDSIPVIAARRNNGSSKVISIDMPTGWSDAYLADDVHYNAAGAKVVADKYYQAIETHVEK